MMPASVVHGPTQIECNPALKYHAVTPPGGPAPDMVTKATYIVASAMLSPAAVKFGDIFGLKKTWVFGFVAMIKICRQAV